jgi:hypothetical protein
MDSTSAIQIERRLRARYEWLRARRAVVGFAPALLIVVAATLLGDRPGTTMLFGAMMFATGAALLWYGMDHRRAVLPGVVAGILPLGMALGAGQFGHLCTGDACLSLCVPACTAGGLAAGLVVGLVGQRQQHGTGYWVGACTLALSTGAMGCTCVGYSGVLGLALGFTGGLIPMILRRRRSQTP